MYRLLVFVWVGLSKAKFSCRYFHFTELYKANLEGFCLKGALTLHKLTRLGSRSYKDVDLKVRIVFLKIYIPMG